MIQAEECLQLTRHAGDFLITQASRWATLVALILMVPTSVEAEEAGNSLDCQAASDRTFQSSLPTTLPAVISGVLLEIKGSRGSLPQAGTLIRSADDKKGIELVVIDSAWSATQLTPLVFGSADSSLPIYFAKVPRSEPIPFSLSLSPSGKAIVSVGHQTSTFNAKPIETAKITLFCNSGQFKFSELNIPVSK